MDPNLNGTSPMTISPIDPGVQVFVDEICSQAEVETAKKIDRLIKDLEIFGAWARELIFLLDIHLEIDDIPFNFSDLGATQSFSDGGKNATVDSQVKYKISFDATPLYRNGKQYTPFLCIIRAEGDNDATLCVVDLSHKTMIDSGWVELYIPLDFYYCNYQMRIMAILSGLVYHKHFNQETVKINIVSGETGFGTIYI